MGDCHYLEGNVQAEKKIRLTKKLFELAGIGSERLHLAWVSSAEAQRFAEIVTDVTRSIKSQGKLNSEEMRFELNAVEMTLAGDMVRWLVGKELKITSQGDVYGRSWDIERFESILDSVLHREYHKNLICQAVEQGYTSVREINRKTGLELLWISRLIAEMEKTNRLVFKGMTDHKAVFAKA